MCFLIATKFCLRAVKKDPRKEGELARAFLGAYRNKKVRGRIKLFAVPRRTMPPTPVGKRIDGTVCIDRQKRREKACQCGSAYSNLVG